MTAAAWVVIDAAAVVVATWLTAMGCTLAILTPGWFADSEPTP